MSSLAAETRAAVRDHPFLYTALRADVVNYSAVARFLDLGDAETVTAALRRFASELPAFSSTDCHPRVSMQSGLGLGDQSTALLSIGDSHFVPDRGSLTGIIAAGDLNVTALAHSLARLTIADIEPRAGASVDGTLFIVVERRDGPTALRVVEQSLSSVPNIYD